MGLNDDVKRLAYDTRLIDWNLKYGQIQQTELNKHLSQLEDLSSQCTHIDLEEEQQDRLDSQQH